MNSSQPSVDSSVRNYAPPATVPKVGVYECEVKLKFRLIEEDLTTCDREELLHILVDAFTYGSDEYLESLHTEISVHELEEVQASPEMRRQLMRLRNVIGR